MVGKKEKIRNIHHVFPVLFGTSFPRAFQPHLVSTQTYVNFSGQRNLHLCFLLRASHHAKHAGTGNLTVLYSLPNEKMSLLSELADRREIKCSAQRLG